MKKILFILSLLVLLSCSKEEVPVKDYFNIKSSPTSLRVGETGKIEAESNTLINYKVNNPLVAKIDEQGNITALKIGETIINATSGTQTKQINIEVTQLVDYSQYKFPRFDVIGLDRDNAYKVLDAYHTYRNLIANQTEGFVYIVRDKATITYGIENNVVTSIALRFADTFDATINYMLPFSEYLLERYTPFSDSNGYVSMISSDLKSVVMFTTESGKNTYITVPSEELKNTIINTFDIVLP